MRVFGVLLGLLLAFDAFAYKKEDLAHLIQTGSCTECDLSYANMQAAFFKSGMEQVSVSIIDSDLKGAMGRNLSFYSSEFINCNLSDTDFRFAVFEEVAFENSNLKMAELSSSKMKKVIFKDSFLVHANFDDSQFDGVDFSHSIWTNGLKCLNDSIDRCRYNKDADIQSLIDQKKCNGCTLAGLNFSDRDLKNADVSGSYLVCSSFRGADLGHAVFKNSTLRNVDFSGANLDSARFTNARLDYAIWSNGVRCLYNSVGACIFYDESHYQQILDLNHCNRCNLATVNLSKRDLVEASLAETNLRYSNLSNSDLTKANLRESDLRNTDLTNAALTSAVLSKADLRGANLSNVDLSEANLTYAIWTDGSICQAGSIGKCIRCNRLVSFLSQYDLVNVKCQFKGDHQFDWMKKVDERCRKDFNTNR